MVTISATGILDHALVARTVSMIETGFGQLARVLSNGGPVEYALVALVVGTIVWKALSGPVRSL